MIYFSLPQLTNENQQVISNKDGVEGLKRAEKAKIPTKVVAHKKFPTREEFDMELLRLLQAADVEFVVLAGFMRILSPVFVNSYRGRLINIHPALLPSFKGTHAHQQALDAGVLVTGCSVHFVEVGSCLTNKRTFDMLK